LTHYLLTKFTCDSPGPSLAEMLIQLIWCNCNSICMVLDVSWPQVEQINTPGQSNLMPTGDSWINILSKGCEDWTCQEGWDSFSH